MNILTAIPCSEVMIDSTTPQFLESVSLDGTLKGEGGYTSPITTLSSVYKVRSITTPEMMVIHFQTGNADVVTLSLFDGDSLVFNKVIILS